MPFATLRGIEFYYEQAGLERPGSGPRLLFLNGTGGDLRHKPRLVDGPLSSNLEILAHDQRGLGRSGKPDVAYSMADYADDAAALLDHVGWQRCHVLGISFGGMVAQELAIRHPGRIDRLVLACTSSGGKGGASYPLHELASLEPDEYMSRVLALSDTRWGAAGDGVSKDRFAKVFEFMRARQQTPQDGEAPEVKAIGARRQLEARVTHDTWDRLADISAPTFLCGGRYDGIAKPENMQNLAQRIPNAELEFFEGGHGFLMEDPRAFARILDFLDRSS